MIGSSLYECVDRADHPLLNALLREGIQESSRGELRLYASGHAVPVYISLVSLNKYNLPAVCAVVTDLTEQKKSEEIVASERLARSILEQAAEAIVVCDLQGRILRASQAAGRMAGGNPLMRPFNEILPLKATSDENLAQSILSAALQGETLGPVRAELERPGEETIFLLVYAGPLRGEASEIVGCTVSLTDITELKRGEKERAAMLEREQAARTAAEQALQLREQFIMMASHELKTPLTSVIGYVELLNRWRDEERLSARSIRAFDIIRDQVNKLFQVVSALFDLNRIAAGQMLVEAAPLDLIPLIQVVVSQIQPLAKHHQITTEVPAVPVMVDGDRLRLEQALHNIIQNAVKYCPGGGEVEVRLVVDDAVATVKVRDQGIGIPRRDQAMLFNRFFRASNAINTHISGIGIGLYVAREIVQQHGGNLAVESEEGKGSTFTLSLPLHTQGPQSSF